MPAPLRFPAHWRTGLQEAIRRSRARAGVLTAPELPPAEVLTFGMPGVPQPVPVPRPAPVLAPPPQIDVAAIRRSISALDGGAGKVAGDFYGYLFAGCPHVRDMFPPQMGMQNERLFAALLKIASLADRPDVLGRYLSGLGADHRKYGVQPEHYAPVGEAMVKALRRHCPIWDEQIEAAWLAAYTLAAETMISGAELRPGPAYWRGTVVRHERRTRDLAVITVRTGQPLPRLAGQYVTVQTGKWRRVWRPFSVANAPGGDLTVVEFHVRAVSGGWVSTALVRDTRPGDEVLIGPPVGTMTAAAAEPGRDLVCVAGGTGLAPIKAVVEAVVQADEQAMAASQGMRRNIHLFHGAHTPRDLYDMPALRELAASYPWVQVVPVVSGEPRFTGFRGCVDRVALDYGDWAGREAYVSGPPAMTRSTLYGLCASGLPDKRVHCDRVELEGVG
jgi:NAD(P)H-flavin reductase